MILENDFKLCSHQGREWAPDCSGVRLACNQDLHVSSLGQGLSLWPLHSCCEPNLYLGPMPKDLQDLHLAQSTDSSRLQG